jgi:NTE family protein
LRIKLGVAFAGGGVRGASHLGVMQAFYENGIYPQIFAGTSAGSVVASLLACGYKPDEAMNKFKKMNQDLVDVAYGHILKGAFTSSHIEGFVKGDSLEKSIDEMLDCSLIEEVDSPLAIVTTEINRGRQIIFTNKSIDRERVNDDNFLTVYASNEKLSAIVRASSGLPPVFIPKKVHNFKLVDGGITNNLPSDVVWGMGADKVISLDLGYAGEVETEGFIDIAHMSVNLLMERVTDGNSDDYGLYLNPKIYDVSALDTSRIDECYERGYTYGKENIDKVVKMLEEE